MQWAAVSTTSGETRVPEQMLPQLPSHMPRKTTESQPVVVCPPTMGISRFSMSPT